MSSMTGMVALLLLVAAAVPALAMDYTVGDTSGWTTGVDYDTWASDKTFHVGDTLLFSYGFLHTVNEVPKADYDSCSSSNLIQSHSDQSTKISLDKAGPRYFICGTASHCMSGMKLTVDAVSTNTNESPSATTPAESSPSTPSSDPSTPSSTGTTVPSEGVPRKDRPTMTGVNGAGCGKGGSALVVGLAVVGLVAAVMG